jgi:ribosomal protein S18 acetylase RimI-like enzyme
MPIEARPATDADLPALAALQQRYDTRWFGAPEHDETEVREELDRVKPLADRSRLLFQGHLLVAAAWWWRPEDATLLVDVEATEAVLDDVVAWLQRSGVVNVEALAEDAATVAALRRQGWQHHLSQFELLRDVAGLTDPRWPDGVEVSSIGAHGDETAETAEVHRLIYEEARWTDVPGHGARDLAEWRGLFLPEDVDRGQQVLARRDGRLVGAALGKTFSDGTGWVAQVAVAPDLRGSGLGSALIAEAFGRRVAAGARRLGLGVSAANADALRLYQRLGLEIDREWMAFRPATPQRTE